jgi:hypothetical protein
MSDLTRSKLIRCHICQSPCDAYMLHADETVELWQFGFNVKLSFCTFYCARQYHRVTGKQIFNGKGETILEAGLPLYVIESTDTESLYSKAIETMVIELLEECYAR